MTEHPDNAAQAERVKRVAKRMTKAQREYMTTRAEWRQPTGWAQERWMTFPPANTHRVLMRLGLVDRVGQMLPFGIDVRDHLTTTEEVT